MSKKVLTPIQLPADPMNPLEAATKQYVDANEEVVVQDATPTTTPTHHLWVDTDDPATPMTSEVEVSATQPTNPNAELWLDTASSPQGLESLSYYRIFATNAARDTWVSPPEGSKAFVTATGAEYTRIGGIWYPAYGFLTAVNYPSADGTLSNGNDIMITPNFVIPSPGRRVKVTTHNNIGGTGTFVSAAIVLDNASIASPRIVQVNDIPGDGAILHGTIDILLAAGTHNFRLRWTMTGTITIYGASDPGQYLLVEDRGPSAY